LKRGLFVLERPFPRFPREVNDQGNWWADGVLMVANESAGGSGGEIAAFGGRLPFWGGGGLRYQGGPITLVFRYDGAHQEAYSTRYATAATTATSAWFEPWRLRQHLQRRTAWATLLPAGRLPAD
jgi:hypothetical protein